MESFPMVEDAIKIEVVKGGFILTYPQQANKPNEPEHWVSAREVFVSPRKLNQKVKEVIDTLSLVTDEE